ncbi:MAG TPA: HAD family hydrolase [Planctomycetota bacterium]|nr:HAD family hydrolase [Planctomycetota bacterium]
MAGKRPLSLITFDIDDTIYSSTDFARLARENALKAMIALGLKIDLPTAQAELDEVVSEFTSNDPNHLDRILQRFPKAALDGINPAILVAAGVVAYRDTVHDSLKPYEDAIEAFKRLHSAGYRLGIVSQGVTIKQAEKLVRLRILPYIDRKAIFFSDQMATSKGNPKFFIRAAEQLGASPAQCMHVGDRPDRDIDPANSAGWLTVLNRRTGRYHERPGSTPPSYVIHNFWDFIEVIDKEFTPASAR